MSFSPNIERMIARKQKESEDQKVLLAISDIAVVEETKTTKTETKTPNIERAPSPTTPKTKKISNWFKSKKAQPDLKFDRQSFIKTFTDGALFTEFREFAEEDDATNYLRFCENFSRLEQLNAEYKVELVKKQKKTGDLNESDIGEVFQSMIRFMGNSSSEVALPRIPHFELPSWLVPHYLTFYASFLGPGAPKWVFVSESCLLDITKALETGGLIKLMSNVFDNAADEILISMYSDWFPRFLANRFGNEIPGLNEILKPKPVNALISISKSPPSSSSASSIERTKSDEGSTTSKKFFGRRRSISNLKEEQSSLSGSFFEISYTKECMARVLYDSVQMKEFVSIIEADHCKENFLFFEAFSNLESLLLTNIPQFARQNKAMEVSKTHPKASQYSRFIYRFLQNIEAHEIQSGQGILIPKQIFPHFMSFYSSFICPGGPNEVNITDKLRRKISETLAYGGGRSVPASIFDGAADEVIGLLYLNTFKRFVKERRSIPNAPSIGHAVSSFSLKRVLTEKVLTEKRGEQS